MKKLSEFKDEEALDLLADIIEPASAIFTDKDVRAAFKEENKLPKVTKIAIKKHKSELIEILAKMEGKEPSEYHCNVLSLPIAVLKILQDQELVDFFSSAVGVAEESASIGLMQNTKETEEK